MIIDIPIGSKWQHENGITYEVMHIANQDSKNADYPITIVYQGENGKIWTKDLNNFLTRMTQLKTNKMFYSRVETLEKLNVNEEQLMKLVHEGEFRMFKDRHDYIFKVTDINGFLEK